MDKEKSVDHHVMDGEDGDVSGVIDPMLLLEPNHNKDYSTTELNQVRVCKATTLEYDVQNSSTMENIETMLKVQESDRVDDIRSEEDTCRMLKDILDIDIRDGVDDIRSEEDMCRMLEDILDVDIPDGVDDIRSEEDIYIMFEDIVVDIPDDWLEDSLV